MNRRSQIAAQKESQKQERIKKLEERIKKGLSVCAAAWNETNGCKNVVSAKYECENCLFKNRETDKFCKFFKFWIGLCREMQKLVGAENA